MKTLGLIGGTTWLSTVEYYRLLNELTNKRLGGSSSCRCLLYSVNFADIRALVDADDWDGVTELVAAACASLQAGGAEAIMLCANTLHLVADKIEPQVQVPLIDLRDATGLAIQLAGLSRVALLGTRFTMERGFFEDRLADYQIAERPQHLFEVHTDNRLVVGNDDSSLRHGLLSRGPVCAGRLRSRARHCRSPYAAGRANLR